MGALCIYCGEDTIHAATCAEVRVETGGGSLAPVPYGAEPREFSGARCGDCGVRRGGFHHPGCDIESCPVCGGQAIWCACVLASVASEPGEASPLSRVATSPADFTWPPEMEPNSFVWIAKTISRGGDWIFCVFHDERGDWLFGDGRAHTEDEWEAAPMRILFHLDPGIGEVLDLAPGEFAWREQSGGAWRRGTFESTPG